MRILFIGEIVGKAGVYCVKVALSKLIAEYNFDFIIANGDGATGGFGIGKNHSVYLRKLGVNVITTGDSAYYKRDMVTHIADAPYILRPANHAFGNPGRGIRHYRVADTRIAVICLLGQSGYKWVHLANPFTQLGSLLQHAVKECNVVLIDFHALTTAEKYSLFFLADGKVSAVIGTGQRVQTADARILPGKTAVICDAGRTGSRRGIQGLEPEIETRKFLRQIPERSSDIWEELFLEGAIIDINEDGAATAITSIRQAVEPPARNTEQ